MGWLLGYYKYGLKDEDLIYSIQIGDREKFTIPALTKDTVMKYIDNLYAYIDSEENKIGDTVVIEYGRYVYGSGYADKTVTFTLEQYVYQQWKITAKNRFR